MAYPFPSSISGSNKSISAAMVHDISPLFCRWRLQVPLHMDISINLKSIRMPSDCSGNFIFIRESLICGHLGHYRHHPGRSKATSQSANIIIRREDLSAYINGHKMAHSGGGGIGDDILGHNSVDIYFSTMRPDLAYFRLYWSHVRKLPESVDSSDVLLSITRECQFLCADSRTCIASSMVCNGFPNCPLVSRLSSGSGAAVSGSSSAMYYTGSSSGSGDEYPAESEDEATDHCSQGSIILSFLFKPIVLVLVSLAVLLTAIAVGLLYGHRYTNRYRRKNTPF